MNGTDELPLVIFTVFAQSVVGAFFILSLVLNRTSLTSNCRNQANKSILVLLILLGIGFIASLSHLGSPTRAFNSLNRIGSSMLSNEIATGGAFFAMLGLYWLLAMTNKLSKSFEKLLLTITVIIGLIFMYMMNQVYHIRTVPTWDNIYTSANFYLTVIIGGLSLFFVLMYNDSQQAKNNLKYLPYIVAGTIFISAIFYVYQSVNLGSISNSIIRGSDLVPDFAHLSALRFLLLSVGVLSIFAYNKYPHQKWLKSSVILFILAGEMVGRTLFYAMHTTVGFA